MAICWIRFLRAVVSQAVKYLWCPIKEIPLSDENQSFFSLQSKFLIFHVLLTEISVPKNQFRLTYLQQ